MKLMRFPIVLAAWLACGLVFGTVAPVMAKQEQPNMHAALDALREAKRSQTPGASLKEAKGRLKASAKDKSRYRVEALALVNQAMEQLKAGKRREAEKLITEAITKVERGIAAAK